MTWRWSERVPQSLSGDMAGEVVSTCGCEGLDLGQGHGQRGGGSQPGFKEDGVSWGAASNDEDFVLKKNIVPQPLEERVVLVLCTSKPIHSIKSNL